ncbi:hypothetical protein SAMN02927914_05111, partial [Mesorhizobium qingshengii]
VGSPIIDSISLAKEIESVLQSCFKPEFFNTIRQVRFLSVVADIAVT